MAFFIWKESFNTNIPEIDVQHQHIFTVLNRLYDAAQPPVDNDAVKQSLHEMNEYVKYHFTTEEELMAKYGYSGLEAQKKQHEYYEKQMIQFSRSIEEENALEGKSILQFMKDWFLDHILLDDLKFGKEVAHKITY